MGPTPWVRAVRRVAVTSAVGGALLAAAAGAFAQEVVPLSNHFPISVAAGLDALGGRPAIASGGTNFLTVWRDARNSSTHADDPYAARVTQNGVVLDPGGIRLSTAVGDAEWPSVAFDGTHYLVVWVGGVGATSQLEIFGTIVAADGTVVAADVPITTGGGPMPRVISVAFDGTNFLVVWRTQPGSHIRGVRVARTGGTLTSLDGTGGFTIASLAGDFYPWVTFGSGQYLVAWHGWGATGNLDIFAARVSTSGVVLDPEGFLVSNAEGGKDHVSVAASGSNYVITFRNALNEDPYRNARGYAVRVSPAGVVLDNPALLIGDEVGWGSMMPVVYDGTNYFAIWQVTNQHKHRYWDLMGRRISPAGVLLDPTPVPVATSFQTQAWLPALASSNGRLLAAWTDISRESMCLPGCVAGRILEKTVAGAGAETHDPSLLAEPNLEESHTWTSLASPTTGPLYSVHALDDTSAFASGDNTKLFRFTGSSWSVWDASSQGTDFGLWANAPHDVWSLGWSWGVKRFNGSTFSYTGLDPQRGSSPMAMGAWGSGPNNMLVVGVGGRSVSFNGQVWQNRATDVSVDLWDVWGASSETAFAVGEHGTLLRWNGASWNSVTGLPTRQSLNGVWGTSASDVFVVGDFGTILHFDGTAWTQHTSGTKEHLFAVAGVSPTEIYAVGFGGTILRYDGGAWHAEVSGTTNNLLDVSVGGNTIWVVGDAGTILRTSVIPGSCTKAVGQTTLSIDSAGGQRSITLTTNCAWRAWSSADWITMASSSNGTGDTSVSIAVQANTSGTSRNGTVVIAGQAVTVTQSGGTTTCTLTLSPTSATVGAAAATGLVNVTASNGSCAWSAVSGAAWLSVTSGASATGSGNAGYAVAANSGGARTGTLTVAGHTFTVSQSGTTPTLLAPTNLVAVVSGNTVTASWTMPAGGVTPTGFVLEGGLSPGGVIASVPTGSTATTFTFAAPSGIFFIRMRALAGTAKSAPSNEVRIVVNVPVPPAAPVELVGEAFGSHLRLAWRNTYTEGSPRSVMLDVTGTITASLPLSLAEAFSFSGVPPGTYTFKVRALNLAGTSASSSPVTLTFPAACAAPVTPANFVATASGNLITIAWSPAASGPTPAGYLVNVTGSFVGAIPTTSLSLAGMAGAGSYTITVVATHPCGVSAPTAAHTVRIPS